MKNSLTIVVAVLIVIVLIAYMFMFQVRYDEVAVLATFRSADESSVKDDPGPYFRLPFPIQSIHKYSRRVQILEDEKEEQQTKDGYAVITQAYLAWRIAEPLAFFEKLTDIRSAQDKLNPLLRSDLRGLVSQYRFDQLVNISPEHLMLSEIEQKVVEQLQQRVDDQGWGIKVEQVGLRRILLPQAVTERVFDRMKATRQAMAADKRASGKGEAEGIRSEANSAQSRILAFAERRAQALRAKGDEEASQFYGYFNKDPELAIFLRRIRTLKSSLKERSTFILSARQLELDNALKPLSPTSE